MKLISSKGNTYTVDWIDGATTTSGLLILEMHDERPLSVIAPEFEGLEWLNRESESQGNKEYIGYNVLKRISSVGNGVVQIALGK